LLFLYVNPNISNGVERNGRIGYRVYFIKSNIIRHVTNFVHFRDMIYDGYESSDGSTVQCHKLSFWTNKWTQGRTM